MLPLPRGIQCLGNGYHKIYNVYVYYIIFAGMIMEKINTVIFDMDGTILDSQNRGLYHDMYR